MPFKVRGDVCIAYPHPVGEVGARFHTSMIDLIKRDAHTNCRVGFHMPISSGANIVTARNKIVKTFLEETNAQWLLSTDADMVFQPDTLDRMLASAEKNDLSIVGALCFALMKGDAQEIVPTLYGLSQAHQLVRYNGFPEDQLVQVVGTGMACILIHRRVFETIRDMRWDEEMEGKFLAQSGGMSSGREVGSVVFPPPWPWFKEQETGTNWGDSISEDLTFCLRAAQAGFPVHVDTSIEIGHVKPIVIDKAAYFKGLPAEEEPAPTFVVIPVKGKQHFSTSILDALQEQGGYDKVFVFDNASGTPDALEGEWKDTQIIPAAGKSIHQMWNKGVRASLAQATRCNIAILNNDLELGPDFLANLASGLRSHPGLAAVSANYDGREFPEKVQAVKGIAAGREDGTGGLAGFAFMVKGEIFQSGCPMFNESYELWYGDTEFCMNLDAAGASYGVVKEARCVHIGGGSNTSGDGKGHRLTPELSEAAERDRVKFEAKWAGK